MPLALRLTAVDQAGAGDHHVVDVDPVDQAVRPVAVALVLQSDEEVDFRRVVEATVLIGPGAGHRGAQNRILRREVQSDVALQTDA